MRCNIWMAKENGFRIFECLLDVLQWLRFLTHRILGKFPQQKMKLHFPWLTSRMVFKDFCLVILLLFSHSAMSNSLWSYVLFPVLFQHLEQAKTHIYWVSDAIQPSHPLSSSSPAFNLSQHQGLFKWVSSLHQVAKVLEFQLQNQSFQWTLRTDLL